jgi:hypothetical protein
VGFTVHDGAVRRFGETVGDLTDDADMAESYVRRYLDIDYTEGRMFFTVVQKANEVRDALVANYQHLARLADQSSREIDRAAAYYERTDRAAALSPEFATGLDPGVEQFAERYDQLSPQQQAGLAERGKAVWDT